MNIIIKNVLNQPSSNVLRRRQQQCRLLYINYRNQVSQIHSLKNNQITILDTWLYFCTGLGSDHHSILVRRAVQGDISLIQFPQLRNNKKSMVTKHLFNFLKNRTTLVWNSNLTPQMNLLLELYIIGMALAHENTKKFWVNQNGNMFFRNFWIFANQNMLSFWSANVHNIIY